VKETDEGSDLPSPAPAKSLLESSRRRRQEVVDEAEETQIHPGEAGRHHDGREGGGIQATGFI